MNNPFDSKETLEECIESVLSTYDMPLDIIHYHSRWGSLSLDSDKDFSYSERDGSVERIQLSRRSPNPLKYRTNLILIVNITTATDLCRFLYEYQGYKKIDRLILHFSDSFNPEDLPEWLRRVGYNFGVIDSIAFFGEEEKIRKFKFTSSNIDGLHTNINGVYVSNLARLSAGRLLDDYSPFLD